MDVRRLTGEVSDLAARLTTVRPEMATTVVLDASGSTNSRLHAIVTNPTSSAIEVTCTPESDDSRWYVTPDHNHTRIEPGGRAEFDYDVRRTGHVLDDTYRGLHLDLDIDLLANSLRYAIPSSQTNVPVRVHLNAPPLPKTEIVARFDGRRAVIPVESGSVNLHDGPMTLECWFNADNFAGRRGLVGKTESSEYGFFVSDGKPSFYIFLSGAYVEVEAVKTQLQTGRWYHIAGVFDGAQARLYLDGQLLKSVDGQGVRRTNSLPLMIGADVDGGGNPTSYFDGRIDGVRLSQVARDGGDQFEPLRRPGADGDTLLLLNMDVFVGPWLFDQSPAEAHPIPRGPVALEHSGE
jgi:hypothetical protein